MYDPQRAKKLATYYAMAALPISALCATWLTAEPYSATTWLLGAVVCELVICFFGAGCLLLVGIILSLLAPESEKAKLLAGTGAALAIPFFWVGNVFSMWHGSDGGDGDTLT